MIAELSIYEPTVPELEAAEVSLDAMIGVWAENLRTLDWIPWRDDKTIWGIDYLPEETEPRLSDPEKHRQELIESIGPSELVDHEGYVTSHCDLSLCVSTVKLTIYLLIKATSRHHADRRAEVYLAHGRSEGESQSMVD